jgi:hypothetical protein
MKEAPMMDNTGMMAGNGPEMRREKNGWCFFGGRESLTVDGDQRGCISPVVSRGQLAQEV